jgi:integrator complex subunit 11
MLINALQVQYMAFSLHTDSKGIMDLVRHVDPRNVVLVHGEEPKMRFLQSHIQSSLNLPCYMPANGVSLQLRMPSVLPVELTEACMEAAMMAAGREACTAALQVWQG